jgi:hypothetical protein
MLALSTVSLILIAGGAVVLVVALVLKKSQ